LNPFPSSTLYDDNCTEHTVVAVVPTDLRLNRTYIIVYVNWIWNISTGIVPFVALLFFNVRIFGGLKKVQRKLGRHQASTRHQQPHTKVLNNSNLLLFFPLLCLGNCTRWRLLIFSK
jgi:hypothetical protein